MKTWEVEFLKSPAGTWDVSMDTTGGAPSDWLQWDEKKYNYIKNRTHYLRLYDDSIQTSVNIKEMGVFYMLRDWTQKTTVDLQRFFAANVIKTLQKNTSLYFSITVSMNINGGVTTGGVGLQSSEIVMIDEVNYKIKYGLADLYFIINHNVLKDEYRAAMAHNGIFVCSGAEYYAGFGCIIGWITALDERYIPTTIARKTELQGLASEDFVTSAIEAIPEQKQVDWEQEDDEAIDFIKNKPQIATDEEIVEMLISLDMLAAVNDMDGALLTDENGNVLLW